MKTTMKPKEALATRVIEAVEAGERMFPDANRHPACVSGWHSRPHQLSALETSASLKNVSPYCRMT